MSKTHCKEKSASDFQNNADGITVQMESVNRKPVSKANYKTDNFMKMCQKNYKNKSLLTAGNNLFIFYSILYY